MTAKKNNKLLFILLALIVLIGAIILFMPTVAPDNAAQQQRKSPEETTLVKAGDTAPDFTVEMLSGEQTTLSQLKGKVVLVTFWATWCPPCREELSHVQEQLIDRFAGRDFAFLPISRGEEKATVEKFISQKGYTFAVGIDPERKVYDLFASDYVPRNFLIGKDGKVILTTVGYTAGEFAHLVKTIDEKTQVQKEQ